MRKQKQNIRNASVTGYPSSPIYGYDDNIQQAMLTVSTSPPIGAVSAPIYNPIPTQTPFFSPGQPYSYPPISTYAQLQYMLAEFKDLRSLPLPQTIILIAILVSLFGGIIVSIYNIITSIVILVKQGALSAPLNIQTIDYLSIKSMQFVGGKFSFITFIVLSAVTLLGVGAFVLVNAIQPNKKANGEVIPISREIKIIIVLVLLSAIVMLITQAITYIYIGSSIKKVAGRVTLYNEFVCSRIYNNIEFLNLIKKPKENIISVDQTIKDALKSLPLGLSNDEYAKAFFTLTMFYHYQKIGLRNIAVYDAFNLFEPTNLLLRQCSPADYLPRYGTYIEDITESYIRPNIANVADLEDILITTSEWVSRANGYANTIYPEDAYNVFLAMTVITFILQLIPLVLFALAFRDPDTSMLASYTQKLLTTIIGAAQSTNTMRTTGLQ